MRLRLRFAPLVAAIICTLSLNLALTPGAAAQGFSDCPNLQPPPNIAPMPFNSWLAMAETAQIAGMGDSHGILANRTLFRNDNNDAVSEFRRVAPQLGNTFTFLRQSAEGLKRDVINAMGALTVRCNLMLEDAAQTRFLVTEAHQTAHRMRVSGDSLNRVMAQFSRLEFVTNSLVREHGQNYRPNNSFVHQGPNIARARDAIVTYIRNWQSALKLLEDFASELDEVVNFPQDGTFLLPGMVEPLLSKLGELTPRFSDQQERDLAATFDGSIHARGCFAPDPFFASGGSIQITNAATGDALTLMSVTGPFAGVIPVKVQFSRPTGSQCQGWRAFSTADGWVEIVSVCDPGMRLVADMVNGIDSPMLTAVPNNSLHPRSIKRMFRCGTKVGDGSFPLINAYSSDARSLQIIRLFSQPFGFGGFQPHQSDARQRITFRQF